MNALTPSRATPELASVGPMEPEPPANAPAEQALLGALLVNNDAALSVAFLRPEHFYEGAHAKIYKAMTTVIGRGERATPATLKHYFDREQSLSEVGGAAYLLRLTSSVISVANVDSYARVILDCWVRRGIIERAQEAIAAANDPQVDVPPLEQAAAFAAGLEELGRDEPSGGFALIGDGLDDTLNEAEEAGKNGNLVGLSTGLRTLDEILGGFEPGNLIIVAGRPGMGKTAVGWSMLYGACADRGIEGAMFSLEMKRKQLQQRTVADRAGINLERVRRGALGAPDWEVVGRVAEGIKTAQVWVDDTPNMTLANIRSRAHTLKKRRAGLGLIVVDYLGLVAWRHGVREEIAHLTEVSKGLKLIALELDVPLVALCQLNRECEKRDNKRPQLADLRGSGSIEQDADVVLGLYYPHHYEPEPPADMAKAEAWDLDRDVLEIGVLKQRQGRSQTTARVKYHRATGRICDLGGQ